MPKPWDGDHDRRVPGRRAAERILLAGVVLVGFSLSGCGLRVSKGQERSAMEAALGNGGQSGPGAGSGLSANVGSSADTGASAVGTATTLGPNGGGSGGGASAAQLAVGGPGGGGGAGSAAPAGGNGGATDVGVTANSITVGNVSDLGGPVPGLFQGGPYGVQAYFNYINSQGGVYGRKLNLIASDDGLQCSQNEADYQNRVSSVFAFVGSWSLDDNCGAQIMSAHPNVPMVQTYLNPQMAGLPNAYSMAPYSQQFYLGPYLYLKQKYPDAITSVGTIVGNQAAAVAAWQHLRSAIESIGYKIAYEDDFPPAQSNFSADVLRMKSQNIKMVVLSSVNAPDAAIFAQEAAQQGFKPEVWVCVVCYSGGYVQESGGASAVEGQYEYLAAAAFLSDPTVPEVATYLHWIHTAYPNFSPDLFSTYSWANAALFVHILQQVGPHLTQKAVLAALAATSSFNDNGMTTTANISGKKPSNCYNLFQIQNGQYVKVDDPATGFRCDGYFAG
ncbi:MAG TPA: ABC transporter substrate-binding protein [Acidimicrobiales bacterium]|nr:ABC transporter substrate-binding protein [Acidimicrobiales bacterium]